MKMLEAVVEFAHKHMQISSYVTAHSLMRRWGSFSPINLQNCRLWYKLVAIAVQALQAHDKNFYVIIFNLCQGCPHCIYVQSCIGSKIRLVHIKSLPKLGFCAAQIFFSAVVTLQ